MVFKNLNDSKDLINVVDDVVEHLGKESRKNHKEKKTTAKKIINNLGKGIHKAALINPAKNNTAEGYVQNVYNSNVSVLAGKEDDKVVATVDGTSKNTEQAKIGFYKSLKDGLSKFFRKGAKAFGLFSEDLESASDERRGFFKDFKMEISNMYGLQKMTDALQSSVGASITSTYDYARNNNQVWGVTVEELMKVISELSDVNKGILATYEDSKNILAYAEKSGMSLTGLNKWFNEKVEYKIDLKEIEGMRKIYGNEAVSDDGKVNLKIKDILQDMQDRGLLTQESFDNFLEMSQSGRGAGTFLKFISLIESGVRSKKIDWINRGESLKAIEDVSKNSKIINAVGEENYSKFIEDYLRGFTINSGSYGDENLYKELVQMQVSKDIHDVEKFNTIWARVKNYDPNLADKMLRDKNNNNYKGMTENAVRIQALLAEEMKKASGKTDEMAAITNILESIGMDKSTIENLTRLGTKNVDVNAVAAQVYEGMNSDNSLFNSKSTAFTLQEQIQARIEGNSLLAEGIKTLNSLGLDVADIVGIMYGAKLLKEGIGGIAKPFGNTLLQVVSKNSSRLRASGLVQSNAEGIYSLSGKGLMKVAGTVMKSPMFKALGGIAGGFMMLKDANEGKWKAEEWGTSVLSSTLGAALGGVESGLSGAFNGAMKGAALGAMFGPIGVAIGGIGGAIAGYFGGEKIAKLLDISGEMIGKFFTGVGDLFVKAMEEIPKALEWVGKSVWSVISYIPGKMWDMVQFEFNVLKTLFSEGPAAAWQVLKDGVLSLANGVKQKFYDVGNWIKELISLKTIKDALSGKDINYEIDPTENTAKSIIERVKIDAGDKDKKLFNGIFNKDYRGSLYKNDILTSSYASAAGGNSDWKDFLNDYKRTLKDTSNDKEVSRMLDTVMNNGTEQDIENLAKSLWNKDKNNELLEYFIRRDSVPLKVETTDKEKKAQAKVQEQVTAKGVETGAKEAGLFTKEDSKIIGTLVVGGKEVPTTQSYVDTPMSGTESVDRIKVKGKSIEDLKKNSKIAGNIRHIEEAAKIVGVDPATLVSVAMSESSISNEAYAGKGNKDSVKKTAAGMFQFIDSTWKTVLDNPEAQRILRSKGYDPEKLKKTNNTGFDGGYGLDDPRRNPELSAILAAVAFKGYDDFALKNIGRHATKEELYMMHFRGPQGALKFLKANNNEIAANLVSDTEVRHNKGIYYNKDGSMRTVGEVKSILGSKAARFEYTQTPNLNEVSVLPEKVTTVVETQKAIDNAEKQIEREKIEAVKQRNLTDEEKLLDLAGINNNNSSTTPMGDSEAVMWLRRIFLALSKVPYDNGMGGF